MSNTRSFVETHALKLLVALAASVWITGCGTTPLQYKPYFSTSGPTGSGYKEEYLNGNYKVDFYYLPPINGTGFYVRNYPGSVLELWAAYRAADIATQKGFRFVWVLAHDSKDPELNSASSTQGFGTVLVSLRNEPPAQGVAYFAADCFLETYREVFPLMAKKNLYFGQFDWTFPGFGVPLSEQSEAQRKATYAYKAKMLEDCNHPSKE